MSTNSTVQNLQKVRANIAEIEKILKVGDKRPTTKSQVFLKFRMGAEGEEYKEIEVSDWAKGANETCYAVEIYKLMLASLKESEDFWLRCASRDLEELQDELNK